MTFIWCMFPEMWSETDRIFCHFVPFFSPLTTQKIKILKNWIKHLATFHFTHLYHKWLSYDGWFLKYWASPRQFFIILHHFLQLYPPNDLENQNFEKMQKPLENIITLHMYIINDNHIMYGCWDMEHDRHNFLSFRTVFLSFYTLNNPKNQNFLKMKKNTRNITILQMWNMNNNHMMYGSWNIECERWNFLSFRTIFAFLPS